MNHYDRRHRRFGRAATSIVAGCCALVMALAAPAAAHGQSSVSVTEVDYEGRAHFMVTTASATYYFDKLGGGLSRIIDRDGNDWISFHKDPLSTYPDSAAAGYRGSPNLVFGGDDSGAGHPGFDKTRTELVDGNRLVTTSNSGLWQWTWRFESNYATLTVNRVDPNRPFWFLYEGTPAGRYSPANQYWGTDATGLRTDDPDHIRGTGIYGNFQWAYFGDSSVDRVLFASQLGQDQHPDTFSYMGSTSAGTSAPDGMTIFGFGRGADILPKLTAAGTRFVIGLIEQSVNNAAQHESVGATIAQITQEVLSASPDTPPVVPGRPVVSDDFSAGLDTGLWTFVNPVGDGTAAIVGKALHLAVPAGTPHDVWTGGNSSARLMQRVVDADFEVEVKFDSPLVQGYQVQGVLVEQDSANLLRFDFVGDGAGVSLFSASISGGVPSVRASRRIEAGVPLYLRVARAEHQWSFAYSTDGVTWQPGSSFLRPLNVSAVGVFAGNAGAAPAHTAVVDYFFNTASPIDGEDGGFRIAVDVVGQGQVVRDPAASAYEAGQAVQLTAVPGPGWTFTGWSGDLTGTSATASVTVSGDLAVTATFAAMPDTTPPMITGLQVTGITADGATVSWTTSEAAAGAVSYGYSSQYELGTVGDQVLKTAHSVRLAGLSPATGYRFRVASTDAAGNVAHSADSPFTTAAAPAGFVSDDFSAPALDPGRWRFVNPREDASVRVTGSQLVIEVPAGVSHDIWTGVNDAPRVVQAISDNDFAIEAKFESTVALAHQLQGLIVEQDASNLLRFDTYSDGNGVALLAATFSGGVPALRLNARIAAAAASYLRIRRTGSVWTLSYSANGVDWQVVATFDFVLTVSTAGVFAGNASANPAHSAVIDYLFNADAPVVPEDGGRLLLDTRVEGQGTVTRSPDLASYEIGTQVQLTAHPAAGWRFVGWAGDVQGSDPFATLTITAAHRVSAIFALTADTTPPAIDAVRVTEVTASSATITWTTNEPASSGVSFGETSAYERGTVADDTLRTSHAITLDGLSPGTAYRYRVASVDVAGNSAATADAGLTTRADTSALVSDDFTGSDVNTALWSFINPRNDAGVRTTGTQVAIEVPAGIGHDVWTSGNFAPRLIQPIVNGDFTMSAKFDSSPAQAYQMHGLLVEQDPLNFLRFDIVSDGTGASLFVATFASGTPVVRLHSRLVLAGSHHLRIERTGDRWTLSYAADGGTWQNAANFDHGLVVTAAGVFAGNAGAAPAYTALVDHVFNAAAPVGPED